MSCNRACTALLKYKWKDGYHVCMWGNHVWFWGQNSDSKRHSSWFFFTWNWNILLVRCAFRLEIYVFSFSLLQYFCKTHLYQNMWSKFLQWGPVISSTLFVWPQNTEKKGSLHVFPEHSDGVHLDLRVGYSPPATNTHVYTELVKL